MIPAGIAVVVLAYGVVHLYRNPDGRLMRAGTGLLTALAPIAVPLYVCVWLTWIVKTVLLVLNGLS